MLWTCTRFPSAPGEQRHAQTQPPLPAEPSGAKPQLQRLPAARRAGQQHPEPRRPSSSSTGELPPPPPGALTWSWPGSSPGRRGRAEGWLSACLSPPCRLRIKPPLAPLCSSQLPRCRHLTGPLELLLLRCCCCEAAAAFEGCGKSHNSAELWVNQLGWWWGNCSVLKCCVWFIHDNKW